MEPDRLIAELPGFLSAFRDPALQVEIAQEMRAAPEAVGAHLAVYLNEVEGALRALAPSLADGQRVLEVGAGLGLVALYLRSLGVAVTGLEPVGPGFDLFHIAGEAIRRRRSDLALPWLPVAAEQLDPAIHGRFDLIFSYHVLEHVTDLERFLARTSAVLAPAGVAVHVSPNYLVPYDPHFAVPVIAALPGLSRALFARRIEQRPEVWGSLNFITARRLRRLAAAQGLKARFRPAGVVETIERYRDDPIFRARHRSSSLVRWVARLGAAPGARAALRRLPGWLASPMIVELRR